jgi:hypothetical protein
MTAEVQRCELHQQRPAFARCMSCTKMLCRECATEWDGIWHCASCLGAQRVAKVESRPLLGWMAVVTGTLLLAYLATRTMVWLGAVLAGFF